MKFAKSVTVAAALVLTATTSVSVAQPTNILQSTGESPNYKEITDLEARESVTFSSGYDIYSIHVAGPFGGEIEIDGSTQLPEGVCGIRWSNPEAWYWAGSGGFLDIPNNGVPVNQLSFSGAYEGCGNDPYVFTTPATPEGWTPADAYSLIVQVDPDNVEWLDSHGAWHPPENDIGPDPKPANPCISTPEFCEDGPGGTLESEGRDYERWDIDQPGVLRQPSSSGVQIRQ